MHVIDWTLVFALLIFLVMMALLTRKYTNGVADFLAANRCARRYLVSVSQGMVAFGAVAALGRFELFYKSGFSMLWWQTLLIIVTIIISLSGWVQYRFRETRCLTMAEFFERRYSRDFRVFAGMLAWLAGIINFGIFPAVGTHFFIHFCSIPEYLPIFGLQVSSFLIVMAFLILIALFFTFLGGQIAVIVTDFCQGMFCNVFIVILLVFLAVKFDWHQIIDALRMSPPEASKINPFRTSQAQDFNVWFFGIASFGMLYHYMAWQGNQAYNVSAISPHEARMGRILATWRDLVLNLFVILVPVIAFTVMNHPDFANLSEQVTYRIEHINSSNQGEDLSSQLVVPLAMAFILPKGLLGGFCAMMLAAFISTVDTYLHSWGSIFIQDVILPFRKKPLKPKQHLLILRLSIIFVAVFIFAFSSIFKQTDYILMFFAITGAVFLGGAGSVILGGLYWKRGSTPAAWASLITGSILALGSIVVKQISLDSYEAVEKTNIFVSFLLKLQSTNGQILYFIAMVSSIIVYISVSLLGPKQLFNLDKLLHRNKYTVQNDRIRRSAKPVKGFKALIGVTDEFGLIDKIIYYITFGWTLMWVIIFFGIGSIYLIYKDTTFWSVFWEKYWLIYIIVNGIILLIVTGVFFVGGIADVRYMFRSLAKSKTNVLDDGMVHHVEDEENDDTKIE